MDSFKRNQRIKCLIAPLEGATGTVNRITFKDASAWVEMDQTIPDEVRSFPKMDVRKNWVNLYPEDCEPVD